MDKKPLTVTDDFDSEFTLIKSGFSRNYGIQTLSLVSHSCLREKGPLELSLEVRFTVYVTLIGSVHSLYYKTRESAKITYDILMKAAERAD